MLNGERIIERPLRWGMVGGGRDSLVGYKHRTGALRDGNAYELVCGAFGRDPERERRFGLNLGVSADRLYPDHAALIAGEAGRDDGVEVVTVATPNSTHYEITRACLEAGLHVVCEKPLFFTGAEGQRIKALAEARGLVVGVAYGYVGHVLVDQMAAMVAKGMLGEIRIVDLQFTHGFNAGGDEHASPAQRWRTSAATSGPTFVLGDVGTHLHHLSRVVLPHMRVERLLCDRQSFVRTRAPLEDNAFVLARYDNGAVGRLWVSSVNAGSMASQRCRFVGSTASLEWTTTQPNELVFEVQGEPPRTLHRGMPYLEEEGLRHERMGALHTEGLADSWANVYLGIAQAIDARRRGDVGFLRNHRYADLDAGIEGVRWLEACVRSADSGATWVDLA